MSSSSVSSSPCSRTSMPSMSSPGSRRAACNERAHVVAALPLQLQPLGDRERTGRAGARSAAGSLRGRRRARRAARRSPATESASAKCATRSAGGPGLSISSSCCVDDLDDPRFQPLHPPDGELAGEHAAQPLMLRWVEAEQVARPGYGLLVLGARRRAGQHESGRTAVAEMFVVGQHLLDVFVPGDEVHLHPEGVDDRAHAGGLPGSRGVRASGRTRCDACAAAAGWAPRSYLDATRGNTNSSMSVLTSGGFSSAARCATPSSTAMAAPGIASAIAIVSVSGNVASSTPATTSTGVVTRPSNAR